MVSGLLEQIRFGKFQTGIIREFAATNRALPFVNRPSIPVFRLELHFLRKTKTVEFMNLKNRIKMEFLPWPRVSPVTTGRFQIRLEIPEVICRNPSVILWGISTKPITLYERLKFRKKIFFSNRIGTYDTYHSTYHISKCGYFFTPKFLLFSTPLFYTSKILLFFHQFFYISFFTPNF